VYVQILFTEFTHLKFGIFSKIMTQQNIILQKYQKHFIDDELSKFNPF